MGTLHSNSPREAISRLESMIMMGGYQLPVRTIREMITGSVDVIVQVARLRDGSRKITHITEVLGMEGDVVTLQNLIVYDITGEDANGRHSRPPPLHRHRSAALLGPRRILRRGGQARRGAGGVGGPGRQRQPARRQECLRRTSLSFAAAMLAALAVGALAYAFLQPYFSGDREKDTRLKELTEPKASRSSLSALEQAASRRKSVADTLKDMENRQKAAEKVTLRLRLERAGLDITPRVYWMASVACGVVLGASS